MNIISYKYTRPDSSFSKAAIICIIPFFFPLFPIINDCNWYVQIAFFFLTAKRALKQGIQGIYSDNSLFIEHLFIMDNALTGSWEKTTRSLLLINLQSYRTERKALRNRKRRNAHPSL